VNVIGLGTQDSAKDAVAFRARHKIKVTTMLWDASGDSWAKLGVLGQPAWVLMDKSGKTLGASTGSIPYADILKAVQ
jgi:thioredoxin-related protein